MNRISTSSSYLAVIANLNDAQARQIQAGQQVSSQKKAEDLKGYARNAETLTAMQSVATQIQGFIDQSDVLADRFTAQDTALNQLADSVGNMRQSITDAIASGRGDTLMQDLRGYFTDTIAALNAKSNGKYLFAGGQIDSMPVSATSIGDLTTAPSLASLFHNDQFKATNRLDETSSIQGGFLADQLGQPLFQALQTIVQYDQTAGQGPLTGQLSQTQIAFLQSTLAGMDTVHDNLTNQAAMNGSYQRRIDDNKTDLVARQTTIKNMMGGITDVDVAEAVSRLQMAQTAVQASAQVFQGLQSSSLLNFLRL
jgi:flagellar hook-associated protein 3 FlgL